METHPCVGLVKKFTGGSGIFYLTFQYPELFLGRTAFNHSFLFHFPVSLWFLFYCFPSHRTKQAVNQHNHLLPPEALSRRAPLLPLPLCAPGPASSHRFLSHTCQFSLLHCLVVSKTGYGRADTERLSFLRPPESGVYSAL